MAFEQVIGKVIFNEVGNDPKNPEGYVNNPKDPGGETKFGISKKRYPNIDIKSLTLDGARALYKRDYFDANHLGDLSDVGLQYYVLDMVVNMGSGPKLFQRALFVPDDGIIGPQTIAAANGRDAHALIDKLIELRVRQYVHDVIVNPDQVVFLGGWVGRAFIRF